MLITTVSDHIFYSYANLAMADYAISNGLSSYDKTCFMIRSRLNNGLKNGKMKIASLIKDEHNKLRNGQKCVYCGCEIDLSIDHLIPKIRGGSDSSDNFVCACRKCNSSKGKKDLIEWYYEQNRFPSIMLLRRYIKLIYAYCEIHELLNLSIDDVRLSHLPFKVLLLPVEYPSPDKIKY